MRLPRVLRLAVLALGGLPLAGCSTASYRLFHPQGPVAWAQLRFMALDVAVMMFLILPVTVMIAVFAWRYRKSANAKYDPNWSHSLELEMVMWGVPFLTVIFLGFFSYKSTLLVNPYGPAALDTAMAVAQPGPLQVDVITTDWQWVFVYPEYGIATVDDLVVPAGRVVQLRLTSTSVTNDFFIPQVAPMIDVMPGMRTKDAFQINHTGQYEGFSADFSGAGFSWMQFSTRVVSAGDFAGWVAKVQAAPDQLSYLRFTKLAKPTINIGAKPAYFSHVEPNLFDDVYTAAQQGVVYPVPADIAMPPPGKDYTQTPEGNP
jgi:cytochrome o ubiquinol oxidase subunit 2